MMREGFRGAYGAFGSGRLSHGRLCGRIRRARIDERRTDLFSFFKDRSERVACTYILDAEMFCSHGA